MASITTIKAFVPNTNETVFVSVYNDGVNNTDESQVVVLINDHAAAIEEFSVVHGEDEDEAEEEGEDAQILVLRP